ncbi:recombinase family protein [Planctomicrobium sp. SH527]|uniref:recombinase family protein n=1 Tax=Planctomicrobium sp. SH527 TaxID=3448123 RepID=UPI003F5BE4DF
MKIDATCSTNGGKVTIPKTDRPIRVAQYVRMSTEHQQYSTSNQEDVIREYAARRGYEIVRTYADEGKSGLSFSGRDSLQKLIADVQAGAPGFDAILVYDVSRWGRFQDADESAYYEYLCKRTGIEVHYCAEQFENDGRPTSTIIKSVKRAMAGEYSRELSSKVFKGQCRLIELGYRQGGAPGFGLRRLLISHAGEPKAELQRGEYKSLQTDRVVLVPGPAEEVAVVHRIYQLFIERQMPESEIAALLNSEGVRTDLGRAWNRGTIRQILTNEKYIGNNVFNRTSFKLKKKHVQNAPDIWIRKEGAFPAVVAPEQYFTAKGILQERNRRVSDEEMLEKLRKLVDSNFNLSAHLIDRSEGMPPSHAYRTRFGTLINAYQRIGYLPDRDFEYVEINRRLREARPPLLGNLVERLTGVGATVTRDQMTGFLIVNSEYSANVVLSRCRQTSLGALRWKVNFQDRVIPDITILVRMDEANECPVDYYLLPVMDIPSSHLLLCESNGVLLDTYQFESLDYFTSLSARRRIQVAA